jgi:iron complex transport system substrate-binding protein
MPLRSFAARLAALLFLALGAAPGMAAEFTDSAGRIVQLPNRIGRVMAADPVAAVLVYVLAPDRLIGWVQPAQASGMPPRYARLPAYGSLAGPNPAVVPASLTRLRPDVIIEAGPVTPERAAFADQTTQTTGIPYILLDNSFDRTPTMLRTVGRLLGVADRSDDIALWAEHAIDALRGRLLIQSSTTRPRVYYGRGPLGMEPALPGTPAAEAITNAGAINVAAALAGNPPAPMSRQLLLQWNPDVIIAERAGFYDSLLRDPAWRGLAAVRNKRVYLEPSRPFGWIEGPAGVNRLIGLYWLSVVLYPGDTEDDVRSLAQDFYDKFYAIKLSDKQIDGIAKTAGIPASDAPHLGDLPLGGTGAPPPGGGPPGRTGITPLPPVTTTPSYLMPR